jgi:hypothetical protein
MFLQISRSSSSIWPGYFSFSLGCQNVQSWNKVSTKHPFPRVKRSLLMKHTKIEAHMASCFMRVTRFFTPYCKIHKIDPILSLASHIGQVIQCGHFLSQALCQRICGCCMNYSEFHEIYRSHIVCILSL